MQQKRKMSKFRTWLYENNLLIQEFAMLIGVDRTNLYRWTKGIRPGIKSMRKIREVTKGVIFDPEDLVDETAP